MIGREDVRPTSTRLDREAVRRILLEAWQRRPVQERNPNVAKRFALEAAQTHPFPCERPREQVILSWIQPHVVRPLTVREPGAVGRWLDRPWFERSHWPLRLGALALLAFCVVSCCQAMSRGANAFGFLWLLGSAGAALITAAVWVDRRR